MPAAAATVDDLVQRHLRVAYALARQFARTGEPLDDLRQVAAMALVKAAHRFDPGRGSFYSYATATVRGELRRHVRDHGWSVHVPRADKEAHLRVRAATDELTARLRRGPTRHELAHHTGADGSRLDTAERASRAISAEPLEAAPGDDESPLQALDAALESAATRLVLRDAIGTLADAEQRVLFLRFRLDWSQREIADHLGVSAMSVSRTVHRALQSLRDALEGAEV